MRLRLMGLLAAGALSTALAVHSGYAHALNMLVYIDFLGQEQVIT